MDWKQDVIPFVGCIFCVLANLYAIGKLVFDGHYWRGILLSIASLCALVYCFSVFLKAIA